GDYMALNFAVARQLQGDAQPASGYVILRADDAGVARMVRTQPVASPRNPDEIALRYRRNAGAVRLATNAYFFPEGQAQRYAGARYGELRVDDAGNAVLAGLLDERLRPL